MGDDLYDNKNRFLYPKGNRKLELLRLNLNDLKRLLVVGSKCMTGNADSWLIINVLIIVEVTDYVLKTT